MIDDTKIQDELLAKLSDISTPEDALKITHKIEAQGQQKSAIQQEHKEFSAVQRRRGGGLWRSWPKWLWLRWKKMVPDTDLNQVMVADSAEEGILLKQCPAWGKECRKCGKKNHFAE